MNSVRRNWVITIGITAVLTINLAHADDDAALRTESTRLEHNAALSGQPQASTRVIQDFADFAGSRANASNLVIGLRRGAAITLTAASGDGQQASPVSFASPTHRLSNSNVYITLALAKQRLANLGIPQPTPEQIRTALIGGAIGIGGAKTRTMKLPGVLTLRSQGMSWAAIAKSQGVGLGVVVNGMQNANHDLIALHLHYVGVESAPQIPVGNGL